MAAVKLRLKELLREHKLTQRELAYRTGMTEHTISRMMRSPSAIRLETINSICEVLDIEPGDLIERIPDNNKD